MRPSFAKSVLETLLERGQLEATDSILAVCAGEFDRMLFEVVGLPEVSLTNLDTDAGITPHGKGIEAERSLWQRADVHDLPYEDGSFDWAWVSDGIHHCREPHRALTEMYRVSRKGIIVLESRDSVAVRLAERLHLSNPYEINGRLLKTRQHGGVNFGPVPNFVYRWTEDEFEKLLCCYDPARRCSFDYFYGLDVPAKWLGSKAAAVEVAARWTTRLAPRQGNSFGMVARKGRLLPYLVDDGPRGVALADRVQKRGDVRAAMRDLPPLQRSRLTVRTTGRWEGWPADGRPASDEG
jgi:ubiquinone/menaquinone biosynthesis C-methylase UbiE